MKERVRAEKAPITKGPILGYSYSGYNKTPVRMNDFYAYNRYTVDGIHPGHPYAGGPFETLQSKVFFDQFGYGRYGIDCVQPNGTPSRQYYDGAFQAVMPSLPSLPLSRKEEARSYGPIGWAKAAPTKPDVNLGQFIAEIKEQPLAVMSAVKAFGNVYRRGKRRWNTKPVGPRSTISCFGSSYLAYHFGWVPFVKDLHDWYQSYINQDKQIATLRNNNCKWQRRRAFVTGSTEEVIVPITGLSYIRPFNSTYQTQNGIGRITTTTSSECWFSGKFRYHIPGLDHPRWGRARALQKMWGLELTPSLVYELMPFSWLIDWFTGFGTIVDNWTKITYDHLVSKYAYIMLHKHITSERVFGVKNRFLSGSSSRPYTSYNTVNVCGHTESYSKTRVEAGPFGFDLSVDLSDWQISILSALGLQKLRPKRL